MKKFGYILLVMLAAAATVGGLLLKDNIATRKAEAKQVVFKLVDLTEQITDPATWGKNFPRQYDGYRRTSERTGTEYGGGGSDTLATDKLKADPRLVTIFDGYAFAIDYRARRGHAYMLDDQRTTKRVTQKPQPGSCLHCHAANTLAYRKIGLENGAPGTLDDPLISATGYAQLQTGFEKISALSYSNATQLVEHPVACVDCHDPDSLQLRVTRPASSTGSAHSLRPPTRSLICLPLKSGEPATGNPRTIPTNLPPAKKCARLSVANVTSSIIAGQRQPCSIPGTTD